MNFELRRGADDEDDEDSEDEDEVESLPLRF